MSVFRMQWAKKKKEEHDRQLMIRDKVHSPLTNWLIVVLNNKCEVDWFSCHRRSHTVVVVVLSRSILIFILILDIIVAVASTTLPLTLSSHSPPYPPRIICNKITYNFNSLVDCCIKMYMRRILLFDDRHGHGISLIFHHLLCLLLRSLSLSCHRSSASSCRSILILMTLLSPPLFHLRLIVAFISHNI